MKNDSNEHQAQKIARKLLLILGEDKETRRYAIAAIIMIAAFALLAAGLIMVVVK